MKHSSSATRKLALSSIALLLTLMLLIVSVYAWFFAGFTANVVIYAGSADCEVELFSVLDYNYDGVLDGDYDFPALDVVHTVGSTSTQDTYMGSIGSQPILFAPMAIADEDDLGGYYLHKEGSDPTDGILLRRIPNETPYQYVLSNMYPSKVVTYAISIQNTHPLNIGTADFQFRVPIVSPSGVDLSRVVSLNVGSNKKLLYSESYAGNAVISVVDDGTPINIGAREKVFLFFSFKFETLEELRQLNSTFNSVTDLNAFITGNGSMPVTELEMPQIWLNYQVIDTEITAVTSINMPTTLELMLAEGEHQMHPSLQPINTTYTIADIQWSSSDTEIVEVTQNGLLILKQTGTVVIVARIGAVTAECTVTVGSE